MPNPVMSARHPVVVSQDAEQLSVFFVGNDGNVYYSWWRAGFDWSGLGGWFYLGDGGFAFNGVVGAVSRNPDQLDVFLAAGDEQVYTAARTGGDFDIWSPWRNIGGRCDPSAAVSVVSRYSDQLDAFFCGSDGHVYTSAWSAGGQWSGWRDIGGFFPANAPVTAVSRNPMQLDLFICGNDGHVYTTAWSAGSDWPPGWRDIGGGDFPPGAPVGVVSRNPDQLDAFICSESGHVHTAWWSSEVDWSGFNGWRDIGSAFPAGAPVSVVSRNPDQLDVFVSNQDGHVYTAWWCSEAGWSGTNGWRDIGGGGDGMFPPGGTISAVSRNPDQIDLFVGGVDYNVYTAWWSAEVDWSGLSGWRNIGGCFSAPPEGLISNSNYFFYDLGNNLTSVLVSVKIDTDFVSTANGFSFQLNCWSPQKAGVTTVWQQFAFYLPPDSKQMFVGIDNWADANTQVINHWEALGDPLPAAALKAGYRLDVSLETDANDSVTAANYALYDEHSELLGAARISLMSLQEYGSTKSVTLAELAPVGAFTFNIGGYGNGTAATLTSGSGTVTYSASNQLELNRYVPTFAAFQSGSFDTGETANLVFSTLPPTRAQATMQEFHYVADHDGLIRKHEGMHKLLVPLDLGKPHSTDST